MSNTNQLLERVRAHPELALVLQRVWEPSNDDYRRLFLAHTELLFPHIDENGIKLVMPCFFAGSDSTPDEERTLEALGESRAARRDAYMQAQQPVAETFEKDFNTTVCLLALRFIERNPDLRALLDEGSPTFVRVAKALSAAPANLDIFDEFNERAKDDRVVDGVLREKVLQYSTAMKNFARRGDFIELAASFDFSLQTLPFLGPCRAQVATLLEARALEYEEYEQILVDLYRARLISNIGTTWWCVSCQDDVTVLTTQSRVSPTQLGTKCLKCRRQMAVGTLYQLDQTLRDVLFDRDGLIGVAVALLLAKRGLKPEANSYVGDQEMDFRFRAADRNVLLECKMHKTNRDAGVTTQHLVTDINQAAKHAAEIRKAGQKVDATWIITNYDLGEVEAELRAALRKCAEKVEAYAIEIIDAKDFVRRLDGGRSLAK